MTTAAASLTNSTIGTATQSQKDRTKLSADYNNFLKTLTTQLTNQDPLNPLDSKDFTSQLAQLSSVEQQININSNLEKLVAASSNNNINASLGYLGKTVDLKSSTIDLNNKTAIFAYNTDTTYQKVQLNIKDGTGAIVRTMDADTKTGLHRVTWDGKNDNNVQLPDGYYTVAVNGIDETGKAIPIDTVTAGVVSRVGTENGHIMLTVNNNAISSDNIISVHAD
jgi:flagellar basal-body rod modification protein FlgD